jgi:branched-chain amino acid transport system permease protein
MAQEQRPSPVSWLTAEIGFVRRLVPLVLLVGLVVVLFGAPLFFDTYQRFLFGLVAIYALGALGFNVLFGWSGQLGLAHAGFFGIGAYGTGLLMTHGAPFPIALIVVAGFTTLVGIVMGFPAVRLRGYFLAIATLAFAALIVRVLIEARSITGGAAGQAQPLISIPDFDTTLLLDYAALITCLLAFYGIWRLMRGRLGRTLKAVRDVEIMVESTGLSVVRYKLIAFGISALLAAAAGGLFGQLQTYLVPTYFDFNLTVSFLIMVVLGGMGSLMGSIIGAVYVVAVVQLLQQLGSYQRLAYGLTFVLVMLLLPGGIASLPQRIRSRTWTSGVMASLGRILNRRRSHSARIPVSSDTGVTASEIFALPSDHEPRKLAQAHSHTNVLQMRQIDVSFGGNHVLRSLDLGFNEGFNGLIGPNGAGKTTVFNTISGYVKPESGEILIYGKRLVSGRQWRIAREGLGRTFQTPRLVPELTAVENVMIGAHWQYPNGHLAELFSLPGSVRAERAARERALYLLHQFGAEDIAQIEARSLPIGSQKIVEIVRALISRPRVLLLDEPAAGLGAADVQSLIRGFAGAQADGEICVVLVEHDIELVRELCPSITVLDAGRVIAHGAPDEVLSHPEVTGAYLGAAYAS